MLPYAKPLPILALKVVSGKLLAVCGIMTAHCNWLPEKIRAMN